MSSSLSSLSTQDITTRGRPIIALPIGSCEQHGPHLPLDTDTRIAVALCERLANANNSVLIAPAIAIAASGEHDGFAGTLSIGTVALTAVIVELVRSANWAAGVVLVNGHGGNAQAVHAAISALRSEQRQATAWWPQLGDGDAHAGHAETSLMLAIAPDAVRMELAEVGVISPLANIIDKLRLHGVASISPNGVLGDPRSASAAHGHVLLTLLTTQLIGYVEHETATWVH
ncbi:MAG: mycofactocin biosynthesis peptidyl-dipeptidase MftE [Ilumatobacteraceae bacterium]